MALQLRKISAGCLQYILVCKREAVSPATLPASLRSILLDFALIAPKSFNQLLHPLAAYTAQLAQGSHQPIQFHVCYADTMEAALPLFADDRVLWVFLLYNPSPEVLGMVSGFSYPALVTAVQEEEGEPRQYRPNCRPAGEFAGEGEFWPALLEAAPAVIGDAANDLPAALARAQTELADIRARLGYGAYPMFRACRNLHRTLCSLVSPASYWEIPTQSIPHDQRPDAVLDLLEHCLKIHLFASHAEVGGKKFGGNFPPMVWVLPSHDPWVRKRLLRQIIRTGGRFAPVARQVVLASFLEQGLTDYNFEYELRDVPRATMAGLQLLSERIVFLDNMAALHGSFRESPCLRSPLQGGSLGHTLGAFNPKTFRRARNYGKVREQIGRAGRMLGRVVSPRLAELIPTLIDTVVAISDLPVEWLAINDEPLAFLVDLCRLPESPNTSLLAQSARNTLFEYLIDESTIKNTLVICGADRDDPIFRCFEVARDLITARVPGVTFAHCESREAFFQTIESVRPDLLIVDCHGDFRDNETGSVLQIGSDTLTGDDIVARNATAPLVVLSCCWGAPIYGCANTIAQAFFEVGALSVLTTMLPVDAKQAAKLYIRLVNNLAEAANIPVHENWSAFVSYLLRTSLFDDCLERLPPELQILAFKAEGAMERRARWQEQTMNPRKRAGMFKDVANAVVEVFPAERRERVRRLLERDDFVPECLFYCHLGRGDLIQFKSWKQSHHLPALES